MTYKALEMQKFFQENYKLSPVAVLEFEFEPFGETDQDKRKSSMAFVKRMNALNPAFEELYEEQHHLLQAFSDMPVVYKLGLNENAFYSLVPSYVKLEKCLKSFQKCLKKHSGQPEVVEYYKKAEDYLSTNVYEMMKQDFALFEAVTTERMVETKAKYPHWDKWDSATPNWELVNLKYKEAKAK